MRKVIGALLALAGLAGWMLMVQPTKGVQPTMITPPVVPWYPTTTTTQFPPWDTSNVPQYGDRQ